jgi:hypothetical protein
MVRKYNGWLKQLTGCKLQTGWAMAYWDWHKPNEEYHGTSGINKITEFSYLHRLIHISTISCCNNFELHTSISFHFSAPNKDLCTAVIHSFSLMEHLTHIRTSSLRYYSCETNCFKLNHTCFNRLYLFYYVNSVRCFRNENIQMLASSKWNIP